MNIYYNESDMAALQSFVKEHSGDDTARLLLASGRFPGMDVPFAVEQIVSRRRIREKLPSWYADDRLVFPGRMAAEQCSSELAASYKQRLVGERDRVADLTGGLGVDTLALSRKAREVFYVERSEDYCKAARHNFRCLGADNIRVLSGAAEVVMAELPKVDVIYIDPSRRDGNSKKRVFAVSDCEPDISLLMPEMLECAPLVIAKLSPMADLSMTLEVLLNTAEIHIVSVRNECKEVLFVMTRESVVVEPPIHCVNIVDEGRVESFTFNRSDEAGRCIIVSAAVRKYLYEPNASILKGGAFKSVCRLGVSKLHVNSHLYTSADYMGGEFPGRVFEVVSVIPFNNSIIRILNRTLPKANIAVRNFPLPADELRRRMHIADGGDEYLFATVQADGKRVLIHCRKVG